MLQLGASLLSDYVAEETERVKKALPPTINHVREMRCFTSKQRRDVGFDSGPALQFIRLTEPVQETRITEITNVTRDLT